MGDMGRGVSFVSGSRTGGLSFVLPGLGGLGVTEAWTWPWYLSWASVVVGAWIFLWGLRVHGEQVWKVWKWLGQLPVSEHQKKLFHEIADKLARLRDLADSPGSWTRMSPLPWQIEHSHNYEATKREAKALVNQISYDEPTHTACNTYIHWCSIIVHDHLHRDMTQAGANLAELDRMGRGIFRYLHAGRSVDLRKVDLPDKPKPTAKKPATEVAAEFTAGVLKQASMVPVETDYPAVLAEAKAIAHELDGRLAYVRRILENEDLTELLNWLKKAELQRVPFDELRKSNLTALTEKERAQARTAVRALDELDRALSLIISEPERHPVAQAAGMFKHRATKARAMLKQLIKVMEADE